MASSSSVYSFFAVQIHMIAVCFCLTECVRWWWWCVFVAQRKEKRETVVRGGGGGGGGGVNVHTRTTIIQTFTHFINYDATK